MSRARRVFHSSRLPRRLEKDSAACNVKTLDGSEIKAYIASKPEWAPKTKAGKLVDWSTAFKVATQLRLIDSNPLEGISNFRVNDKAPIEIIPTDKVKDLISKAPERTRAALVLKFFTGMRTSEVCKLDWSAINLERRTGVSWHGPKHGDGDNEWVEGAQKQPPI